LKIKEFLTIYRTCSKPIGSLSSGFALLFFVRGAMAFQQNVATPATNSQSAPVGELERVIGMLTVWVAVLGIFSSVVVVVSAINIVSQIYQARKVGEKIKNELLQQMESEIADLKEKYKLAVLKPPVEILDEIRREYDPLIESVRQLAEREFEEIKETNARINKLDDEIKSVRESIFDIKMETKVPVSPNTSKN
jgi:hypothetical protein